MQQWELGSEVRLRTTLGDEVAGTVFAYDAPAEVLLLKEAGAHNGVSNLRLLATSQVAETLSERKPVGPVDLELPVVDEDRCRRREEKALRLAEQDYDRVGVGVSKEAQAIFEALSKTLPCKWRKKTIVVLVSGRAPLEGWKAGGDPGGQVGRGMRRATFWHAARTRHVQQAVRASRCSTAS